ncbi:hypothetical protein [Streptomyces sp. NBC_00154]|uniref:hypothetical protein n=1 Tax=Streptomyces sp. NBC_00154 TaxID=2975670 RepID=UPI002251969B|nr:hypothetical protein [Streptomyces sp. NBC_00154]MCX5311281.1 insulinase family protein [Streptomyces sp. NBC_00154]
MRDWARTRFTRDNAVLWITSDTVPDGLDLALPAGSPQPPPVVTSALPVTPAFIHGDDGGVVLDGIVRRSTAATLLREVLGRALYTDLRQNGGYSYIADSSYHPRDNDFATITAFADALPRSGTRWSVASLTCWPGCGRAASSSPNSTRRVPRSSRCTTHPTPGRPDCPRTH